MGLEQQDNPDEASTEVHPELSSRLDAFADAVLRRHNQIYECLTTFETELLHAPDSYRATPCEIRRLLSVEVLDVILPALPVAKFTPGNNGRNINGKLKKAAKAWDVDSIYVLFSIGFDYEPQGQQFFVALEQLSKALPDQFGTAIAQLCARARSRRWSTAFTARTESSLNNKYTPNFVLGDVQAVLASVRARHRAKNATARDTGNSETAAQTGAAESAPSPDLGTFQPKTPPVPPATLTREPTAEPSAPRASTATHGNTSERSTESPEIARRRSSSFDPFADPEPSPVIDRSRVPAIDKRIAEESRFGDIYDSDDDNFRQYDDAGRFWNNFEDTESPIEPTYTGSPVKEPSSSDEPDCSDNLDPRQDNTSQSAPLYKTLPSQSPKDKGEPVMAGDVAAVGMPRGIKRARREYDREHVQTLVRPETPVQAEWLDQAFEDIFSVMAPSMSYVGPSDMNTLVKPDGRPSLRIADPIWESTLTILVIELGEECWALAIIHHHRQQARSINLFDPSPSDAGFAKAQRLIDIFVERLLPKTPPERRIVQRSSTPLQDNAADNGVFIFACAMCIESLCPAEMAKPPAPSFEPLLAIARSGGEDDPFAALHVAGKHWADWYAEQQELLQTWLQEQIAVLQPAHGGVISAIDALDRVLESAERLLEGVEEELEKVNRLMDLGSDKNPDTSHAKTGFDRFTAAKKNTESILALLNNTSTGLQALLDKVRKFNQTVEQKKEMTQAVKR
ncbi:hypothetical protein CSOJ01_15492 [Colletotrichum sojae]|uniref:Uncharacterized protein n=1 Tax=Colletotrichum sojae TaxID=2175907 RepID=A0A8H6IN26_9PEZI|nr:hypothetical protein CSOJ01_15492 [Colletotrichum sojae]